MAATNLGTDLIWVDDLDPTHRLESGTALVGHAIYRRLITPRGQLIDDLDYGLGLRELLHRALTPAQVAAVPGQIKAECLKDERVTKAEVTFVQLPSNSWQITVRGETADGPFKLVIDEVGESLTTIAPSILGGT
jgi:phage baseplate assembly protein W